MGSSGNHTFGDYKPSGTTKCDESIDVLLEDVERLEFYQRTGTVPNVGLPVRVRRGVVNNRLVVEDAGTGVIIGNLPTRFNYIRLCQEQDYRYEGTVTVARSGKLPVVGVHLDPI